MQRMWALLTRAGDMLVRLQRNKLRGLSTGGVISALIGLYASLMPSLLPRPWVIQGVISGLVLTAFYPMGVFVEWVVRKLAGWAELRYTVAERARRVITVGWFITIAVVYLGAQAFSLSWQRESARLVGAPEPSNLYVLGSLSVMTLVFLVVLTLYRGIHWLVSRADQLGRRMLPAAVSRVVATLVVLVLTIVLVDRLVLANILQVAERTSIATNNQAPEGLTAPTSPLRTGGPGSSESWQSLGTEGAQFVSKGPDAAQITAITGRLALEPIRAYAGLGERSLPEVVDVVIAELERTGAFDRAAILVYTTTGTGWVNEWHASAFEYLGAGDTAIAAMQYSTFPSALALLTDTQTPREAGMLLYTAVLDRIEQIPQAQRPRLFVGGESLGAFGGNGAFSSPGQMLDGVDGAVWTGTPGFTPLHRALTGSRSPGSTQVNPVIDNGLHFRFAANQAELGADQFGRPLGEWESPRVVYLQHPSDPVVWWSMDLLFNEPEWIDEHAGADVTGQIRWVPIATLLQISADMAVATNVDIGHGHIYQDEVIPAWAGALGHDPHADYSQIIDAIRAVEPAPKLVK